MPPANAEVDPVGAAALPIGYPHACAYNSMAWFNHHFQTATG